MDILFTTMNGNAFALQTMVPYEPILTWTEQNQCSRNGGTWRSQYQGIYVLPASRAFRDIIGANTLETHRISSCCCLERLFCLFAATASSAACADASCRGRHVFRALLLAVRLTSASSQPTNLCRRHNSGTVRDCGREEHDG